MSEGLDRILPRLPRPKGMRWRQWRFAVELLGDPERNQTQAAIRAGYSKGSATDTGYALVRHPKVRAVIEEGERLLAEQWAVTPDRVCQGLLAIAELDVGDLFTPDGELAPVQSMPKGVRQSLQAIETTQVTIKDEEGRPAPAVVRKVKLGDRVMAWKALADLTGMTRREEVAGGPGPVTIVKVVVSPTAAEEVVEGEVVEPERSLAIVAEEGEPAGTGGNVVLVRAVEG